MASPYQAEIETLRSVAFGAITNSFAVLGSALANPSRILAFTNTTDADMLISDDGTNNKLVVPAGTSKLYDLTANRRSEDLIFAMRGSTQFYVKYVSAPTRGAIYLETIYGNAGS